MCREWGRDTGPHFTMKWHSPPCPAVWGSIFHVSLWVVVEDSERGPGCGWGAAHQSLCGTFPLPPLTWD